MRSRIPGLALISSLAVSGLVQQPAFAQAESFHFIPGTFDTQLGPDGNSAIYRAPSGLVVIDSGRHPAHSQQVFDYADSVGQPIVAVINTHWHFDHTTGNLDIRAAYPGARIYATRAIDGALTGFLAPHIVSSRDLLADPAADADRRDGAARFLAAVDQEALQPDVPVEATLHLPVDGGDLELNVTHHAVSESDIWVWDATNRTVIAGDLVTLPAPLFDTACADGWSAALDEIEAKPFERLVPGHGFIMSREDYGHYRRAFDNLIACAAEKPGEQCAPGWLEDAAPLLDQAPGEDFASREYASAAVTYYVDNVIRSAEKREEYCGDPATAPDSP